MEEKKVKRISKSILALFLAVVLAVPASIAGFTTEAKAAEKTYVSDVYIGADLDKFSDVVTDLNGVGCTKYVNHDLNCGVGGCFITVGWKETTDPSKAITGLLFSSSSTDTIVNHGITYTQVGRAGTRTNGNFSQGADDDLVNNWLYVTKDPKAGIPITELGAWCSRDSAKHTGNRIRHTNGYVADLNDGSGDNNYVYLTYSFDEGQIDTSTEQNIVYLYEDPENIPNSTVLFKDWLTRNDAAVLRSWIQIANAINMPQNEAQWGRMNLSASASDVVNVNNPQMAAQAIAGSAELCSYFSTEDRPTYYIKGTGVGGNTGLIFTNFRYVDDGTYFHSAAENVKKGDSIDSLYDITISQGTIESMAVDSMVNQTSSESVLTSNYQNSTSITNTFEVSNTNATGFNESTGVSVGTSATVSCNIPFGSVEATVSTTVEHVQEYSVSWEQTRSSGNSDTVETASGSSAQITIPAHASCDILRETGTSTVVQKYNGACILTYDVYYIMQTGNVIYTLSGLSDGNGKYGGAAESAFHRSVTNLANELNDQKIDSANSYEKTIDWSLMMSYYPKAKEAIYELYRNLPYAPYGGTLTSVIQQTTYKGATYKPLYALQNLTPNITELYITAGESISISDFVIKATDKDGVAWCGFNQKSDGYWEVESGPASIEVNSAGHQTLLATGAGTAVLRYRLTNTEGRNISDTLDNQGITVVIFPGQGGGGAEPTEPAKQPSVGEKVTDTASEAVYKVTSTLDDSRTVEYTKPSSEKAESLTVPRTVMIDGENYKVTSIADSAFKNNKNLKKVTIGSGITKIGKSAFAGCTKLTTVTIGKNVTSIGAKAFYKCKNLKTIKIKTTKLTAKSVGKNALKGTHKKATVKVPGKSLKSYKGWLVKKGLSKSAKIKK